MRIFVKTKALTLIELITAVIIVSVLAAVAVPTMRGAIDRSRGQRAIANLETISAAAHQYYREDFANFIDVSMDITSIANINGNFLLNIQDSDFTYSGIIDPVNGTYTITAARGTHSIGINENDVIDTSAWPYKY